MQRLRCSLTGIGWLSLGALVAYRILDPQKPDSSTRLSKAASTRPITPPRRSPRVRRGCRARGVSSAVMRMKYAHDSYAFVVEGVPR
jgi:hypothetical protein